jgi:hypothetical protein
MTDRAFAVVEKDGGRCVYVGLHANASAVWTVFLGWPDDDEISQAKKKFDLFEVDLFVTKMQIKP